MRRRWDHGAVMMFFRRPAAPLDGWIESIWLCRDDRRPRALERVLPSGAAQLIVNLAEDETRVYEESPAGLACQRSPGAVLNGLATRYQIIDTDEQAFVAGVVFRPGGTSPFVAAPASELRDADVPMEALWGRQRDRLLREQLLGAPDPNATLDALEATLLEVRRDKAAHPAVRYALAEFRAHPSVARIRAVTDAIGLSPKRFIERFKADVGVTPKRYCRILRFQRRRVESPPPRPDGLDGARAGVRLFRPGPPDPRLPRVFRADTDGL